MGALTLWFLPCQCVPLVAESYGLVPIQAESEDMRYRVRGERDGLVRPIRLASGPDVGIVRFYHGVLCQAISFLRVETVADNLG